MQLLRVGFSLLLLIASSISLYAKTEAISQSIIDLNKKTAWVHHGWNPASFPSIDNEGSNKKDKWYKVDAVTDGRRIIRMEKIPFDDIKIPGFFSFEATNPQKYIIYLPFRINQTALDEIIQPAMFLTSLGDNYKIEINGHIISEEIDYSEEENIIHTHLRKRGILVPFHAKLLKPGHNEIKIYLIAHPGSYYAGMTMNSEWLIGNYPYLKDKYDETMDLIFMYIYLFTGFYHLLLYIRRPKERYNLFFSLFSNGLFLYFLSRSNIVFDLIRDTLAITVSELSVLFLISWFLVSFIDEFLIGRSTRFVKIYGYISVFLVFASIGFSSIMGVERFCSDIVVIWQLSMIVVLPYMIFRIIKSNYLSFKYYFHEYKKKMIIPRLLKSVFINIGITPAGNILLGTFVLIFAIVYDILDASVFHTGITIAKYAFFTMVLGIVVSLTNRFLNVYQQVEELNLNLEKKVKERTKDLNDTLERVRDLKSQQDGDYFLTSLLIDPLNQNFANNDKIKIDFFIEEKKKFKFRRWNKEIGGDICYAHSITLRGVPHSFILNADAMGKSMQGAGGVLVLGTVIKSIIERTLSSPVEKNLYPEKWLRNVFIELQKVFESFDGSMLISCVIGLINEKNGLMYFMNAEHPWTILYRDRKAGFIEDKMTFHKIGILGVEKQLWIQTFPLKKNDIIFAGSDGRDDLLMGYSDEGIRIINEDEYAILKHIEKSEGDLERLVSSIKKHGELTDDLSLLRIESKLHEDKQSDIEKKILVKAKVYQKNGEVENAFDILETSFENDFSHIYWQNLIRLALSLKKWDIAFQYGRQFIEIFPQYTEYFYFTALSGRNSKNINKATDYAEIMRLREPYHLKNLILLADLHRLLGNTERAQKIIDEALEIEPGNQNAKNIEKFINNGK